MLYSIILTEALAFSAHETLAVVKTTYEALWRLREMEDLISSARSIKSSVISIFHRRSNVYTVWSTFKLSRLYIENSPHPATELLCQSQSLSVGLCGSPQKCFIRAQMLTFFLHRMKTYHNNVLHLTFFLSLLMYLPSP